MSEGIGREFMKKTQYKFMKPSGQSRGFPPPPLELEYDKSLSTIHLPSPSSISVREMNLRTVIERRESIRKYSSESMSLEELSWLLWCTQGVKEVGHVTLRNVPSAGARHAFETFLLVNNVKNLEPGLYRYLALKHELITINSEPDIAERLTEACLKQSHVRNSAVTFFWVAIVDRMKYRYGERGYRYLHLDAGHVCQNLYLAAENINCGVCAIAAFEDKALNSALNVDGENQFVIYLGTVGKKR
ncbi:MAG: SagB/ThcOx family dehydrogenase [Candidatus Heimdallarchaeota archaeon]|nr:MAG: SagB/ThcOx family dehydrogenase [Candidatus Heimdallarchaeota archaeon]